MEDEEQREHGRSVSPSLATRVGGLVHGVVGWPIFAFWTALVGVAIALDRLRGDPIRRGALAALRVSWGHCLWWTQPGWRRRVEGRENVGPGPYVIVSNHRSVIDIPCLLGLGLPLTVVARSGLFEVPVLGRFVRWSGQIDTADFDRASRAALAAGISVLVFPEGTRSTDAVGRFHLGAFHLAHDTGTPLLPIATDGAQVILTKGRFMPTDRVARVRVRVLPAVRPDAAPRELCRTVRASIVAAVAELS